MYIVHCIIHILIQCDMVLIIKAYNIYYTISKFRVFHVSEDTGALIIYQLLMVDNMKFASIKKIRHRQKKPQSSPYRNDESMGPGDQHVVPLPLTSGGK